MTKLSVNQFKTVIHEQLEQMATDYSLGYNYDHGTAFRYWIAGLILATEQNLQGEVSDVIIPPGVGIDLVLEDEANRTLLLCVCKYKSAQKPIEEEDVLAFCDRHREYMTPGWIREHGAPEAVALLDDYAERVEDGWNIEYWFISTGQSSTELNELIRQTNEEYEKAGERVYCQLHDFSGLKDYYVRSLSLEASIPEEVILDLPSGQFFEKSDPLPTVIAVIKGNSLRNLYRQHKQSLYAWNIRGYLGNRGINQDISNTAKNDPATFFYYNNGVSAICTNYRLDNNRLVATSLQIINGAQTVSTLAGEEANYNVEVLFRLTKTQNVNTDKGINQSIIKYNNSQNVVKVSDFRSNDPIHLYLEENLRLPKPRGALPAIQYIRKRSVGKRGRLGNALKLEEFAKIRYSFLYEPTTIHASPKALWTPEEDGGSYEKAFGVEGEVQDVWSKVTLNETLLAIAFYVRITSDFRALSARNKKLAFMPRLKFHALSLAGDYVRSGISSSEYESVYRKSSHFESVYGSFSPVARQALITFFRSAEDAKVTLFALVRSLDRWNQLSRTFELQQLAAETEE